MIRVKCTQKGYEFPENLNKDFFAHRMPKNYYVNVDFSDKIVLEKDSNKEYMNICNILNEKYPEFNFTTKGVTAESNSKATEKGPQILSATFQLLWT